MISLYIFQTEPSPCGYLPQQEWSLLYELVAQMSPEEYSERLLTGWRRFGHALFRPKCPSCSACWSLRIPVESFRPNRSQRRNWKANAATIRLVIDQPRLSQVKLDLYRRYHDYQHVHKGWENKDDDCGVNYAESFVNNPLPTEEWCYYLDRQLIGVGYVDRLAVGLSAIYFFYEPAERHRGLGTYNILRMIEEARRQRLPHVYLGYYVRGCHSLEYKANFRPNEIYDPHLKRWIPHRCDTTD